MGVSRCLFAVIDGDLPLLIGKVYHHESSSPEVAGPWEGDGQGESCGNRGIDCIPPFRKDCDGGPGGMGLLGGDHPTVTCYRLTDRAGTVWWCG